MIHGPEINPSNGWERTRMTVFSTNEIERLVIFYEFTLSVAVPGTNIGDIDPEPKSIWSQTLIEFAPRPNEIGSLFVLYEMPLFLAVPGTNAI